MTSFFGVCVFSYVVLYSHAKAEPSSNQKTIGKGVRGEGNEKKRRFSPPSTEKSEKRVTCFATFLKNKLNSDILFYRFQVPAARIT